MNPTLNAGGMLFDVGLVALGAYILLSRLRARVALIGQGAGDARQAQSTGAVGWRAALACLLVVATVLRFQGLSSGLWLDELVTLVLYARLPVGEILTTYDSQNQHLLYSLLARSSFLVFGEGPWSLRLPAVLFGIASLWAVYDLGQQVTSQAEAVGAVGLLTFSQHHIWFSQNARGYTGLLFFTLLSSGLLLRAMRRPHARPWWVGYALAAAAGMWLHVTMSFTLLAHLVVVLFALVQRRPQLRSGTVAMPIWGFALTALLTFQLYALVLPQFLGAGLNESTTVGAWKSLAWTFRETISGLRIDAPGLIVGLIAGGAFCTLGTVSFLRRDPAVPILLFVPAAAGTFAMAGMHHPLWPRFFFFLCGFAALIVVRSLSLIGGALARLLRLTLPGAAVLRFVPAAVALATLAATADAAFGPKQDYAGARDFVLHAAASEDAVVIVGLAAIPYRYYAPDWPEVRDAGQLLAIRQESRRTWVVATLLKQLESDHPDIAALLRTDFEQVARFAGTLRDGDVLVYVSKNAVARYE